LRIEEENREEYNQNSAKKWKATTDEEVEKEEGIQQP